jgi:hypothetical protein
MTFWFLERKLNWKVLKSEVFFINYQCKIRKPSTIRQEDFRINFIFRSDFLVYLGFLLFQFWIFGLLGFISV